MVLQREYLKFSKMSVMPFSHNVFDTLLSISFGMPKDFVEISCAAKLTKHRHSTGFKTQENVKHITKHVILLSEKVTQSPNWVYHIYYHNDETPLLHK